MELLEVEFIKGFIRLMDDGSRKGWHERNGGNLSYRIKESEIKEVEQYLTYNDTYYPIKATVKELANEYFLVSATGKYFRNSTVDPLNSFGLIQIDELGLNYRIIWGFSENGKPTSELPSHLLNHQIKKRLTKGLHRVIYHAHTTNLIALTFVLPLDDKVFTRALWEMATECPVVFPEGVGLVPWMVPGSENIGVETSKLMKKYNVAIWAHHGTFVSGESFDNAFGLMDTVEKAAEILVKVMSMSNSKQQTITNDNLKELGLAFNVTLNPDFLD